MSMAGVVVEEEFMVEWRAHLRKRIQTTIAGILSQTRHMENEMMAAPERQAAIAEAYRPSFAWRTRLLEEDEAKYVEACLATWKDGVICLNPPMPGDAARILAELGR